MRKFTDIFKREDNAISLGRVAIFAFAIELFALIPIVLIWLLWTKSAQILWAFGLVLGFWLILFFAGIHNKKIECQYLKISNDTKE